MALGRWLRHAGASVDPPAADGDEMRQCLANVRRQLDHLRTYPSARRALDEGRLRLVGMYFDIADARMHVLTTSPERTPTFSPGENRADRASDGRCSPIFADPRPRRFPHRSRIDTVHSYS
jgi:hypothetical protein